MALGSLQVNRSQDSLQVVRKAQASRQVPVELDGHLHYPPNARQGGSNEYALTVRLPNTAWRNPATGYWEETDPRRVEVRERQIEFAKASAGYQNYRASVPKSERQEGNERHPLTPRARQVCSKRSWDSQVGAWRKSLHLWDHRPPPAAMRLSEEQLRQRRAAVQPAATGAPELAPHAVQERQDLLIRVKGQDAARWKLIAAPRRMRYSPFEQLVEAKLGTVSLIRWRDHSGDPMVIDDDDSLAHFLERAEEEGRKAELVCELSNTVRRWQQGRNDLLGALETLSSLTPTESRVLVRLMQSAVPCGQAAVSSLPTPDNATPPPSPAMPALLLPSPVDSVDSPSQSRPPDVCGIARQLITASPCGRPPRVPIEA